MDDVKLERVQIDSKILHMQETQSRKFLLKLGYEDRQRV